MYQEKKLGKKSKKNVLPKKIILKVRRNYKKL